MKYGVVIVGLGRIACGNIGLAGEIPMSHRAAIEKDDRFYLAGLVERNRVQREKVSSELNGLPATVHLEELQGIGADVVAICTPPEERVDVVEAALRLKPKVVILEKPMAGDLTSARKIMELAERENIPILINFQRRFDPKMRNWRKLAPRPLRSITVTYGRGLYNYASHAIDLIVNWYGPISELHAISTVSDEDGPDPSLSFVASLEAGGTVVVLGHDSLMYDLWDMDIIGDEGKISFRAGGAGAYLEAPEMNRFYSGYAHLGPKRIEEKTIGGFAELYDAVGNYLASGIRLDGCDARQGLENMAILEAVHRSAREGGSVLKRSQILKMVHDEQY